MNTATLDTFTRSYLGCALWSSNDNSTEQGGEPLDANYSIDDLAPEAIASAVEDCTDFQRANFVALAMSELSDERAGFLFWLNRNGHGSGFWDEYSHGHPLAEACNRLADASKVYGYVDLYVGDDEQIYSN